MFDSRSFFLCFVELPGWSFITKLPFFVCCVLEISLAILLLFSCSSLAIVLLYQEKPGFSANFRKDDSDFSSIFTWSGL